MCIRDRPGVHFNGVCGSCSHAWILSPPSPMVCCVDALGLAGSRNVGRTGAFTGALAGSQGRDAARICGANAPHSALASPPQQKTPRRGGGAFLGLLQGGEICISIYVDLWEVGGPLCAAGRVDGSQLPYERRQARPRSFVSPLSFLSRKSFN